jgi:peptide-methionine (S)-S-oxide reductase
MAAVFCENEEQARLASKQRAQVASRLKGAIQTPVITGAPFHRAEDYHQKYYLRHDPILLQELASYSPLQLADSTVAARLNGWIGSRGTRMDTSGLSRLGLSATATAHLESLVHRRQRG